MELAQVPQPIIGYGGPTKDQDMKLLHASQVDEHFIQQICVNDLQPLQVLEHPVCANARFVKGVLSIFSPFN